MRCALVITDEAGRQLFGITDEHALAHVKLYHELPKYEFNGLRVVFVVEPTPEEFKPSLWARVRNWLASFRSGQVAS